MINDDEVVFYDPPKQDLVTGETLPACRGTPLYYEDYEGARTYTIGPREMNEAEILRFGKEFDRQFIHTDPERAKGGPFGSVIASGWHTTAIMMQMLVGTVLQEETAIAGAGVEGVKWMQPVLPGARLTLIVRPTQVRASRSNPDRGLVRFEMEMVNQHEVVVMETRLLGVVRRRHVEK